MTSITLYQGDSLRVLKSLPSESVDCVITSPPYWGLRDYGVLGQLGMEPTLAEHIENLVELFREIRRVLTPKGTCWLNYGDCYATQRNGRSAADTKSAGNDDRTFRDKPFDTIKGAGLASGNLCLIPERLALALQADGWIVRSRIVWGKRNTKPDSSGRYRPSYNHEMIWMLSKQMPCFYDSVAVRQPTAASTRARLAQDVAGQLGSFRQPGKTNGAFKAVGSVDDRLLRAYEGGGADVWEMATASFKEAHFATFPPELVYRCIEAGCPAQVCSKCRSPYEREVEKEFVLQPDVSPEKAVRGAAGQKPFDKSSILTGTKRGTTRVTTLGFRQTCTCTAEPTPGIVLDPFMGAGTTALVARELQRDTVGIELSEDYLMIARRRLGLPEIPLSQDTELAWLLSGGSGDTLDDLLT